MQVEDLDDFLIATGQANLRSSSGLGTQGSGDNGELLHWKKVTKAGVLARESAELVRAGAVTAAIQGIRPVRIRACVPQEQLLITECVDQADTLFNRLWNRSRWWAWSKFSAAQAEGIGRRLGEWLRTYHDSTAQASKSTIPLLLRISAGGLRKLKSLCTLAPDCLSPATVQSLERFLRYAGEAPGVFEGSAVAQIHGDMDLANVLVRPDNELFVADFADTREGIAWEDFARLYHSIRMLTQLSPHRLRLLEPCLTALLTAYREPERVIRTPLFQLIRCHTALCSMLVYFMFGARLGFSGRRAARQLADANGVWLASQEF